MFFIAQVLWKTMGPEEVFYILKCIRPELLCAEDPVTCVAQTRADVGIFIETAV